MPKPVYRIKLSANARTYLGRLDKTIANRIWNKLDLLAQNIETTHHVALKGEWRTHYKLRVGDYRVIYKLDHDNSWILVVAIGHRSDVYYE